MQGRKMLHLGMISTCAQGTSFGDGRILKLKILSILIGILNAYVWFCKAPQIAERVLVTMLSVLSKVTKEGLGLLSSSDVAVSTFRILLILGHELCVVVISTIGNQQSCLSYSGTLCSVYQSIWQILGAKRVPVD